MEKFGKIFLDFSIVPEFFQIFPNFFRIFVNFSGFLKFFWIKIERYLFCRTINRKIWTSACQEVLSSKSVAPLLNFSPGWKAFEGPDGQL